MEVELYNYTRGRGGGKSPCVQDIVTFWQVPETGPFVYFGTDRPQGPLAQLLTRTRRLLLSCPALPSSVDLCNSTQVHYGGEKGARGGHS